MQSERTRSRLELVKVVEVHQKTLNKIQMSKYLGQEAIVYWAVSIFPRFDQLPPGNKQIYHSSFVKAKSVSLQFPMDRKYTTCCASIPRATLASWYAQVVKLLLGTTRHDWWMAVDQSLLRNSRNPLRNDPLKGLKVKSQIKTLSFQLGSSVLVTDHR